MAKKVQTVFVCQECGYESPKWMGRCICGAWGSFVEEKITPVQEDRRHRTGSSSVGAGNSRAGVPVALREVRSSETDRIITGVSEFDRVLGGGFVKGSLTLISGEPGIGKSTLILQAAAYIAEHSGTVLYVSGEESEEQVRMRADRICPELSGRLFILSETSMENIMTQFRKLQPVFMIIDSIQTMYTSALDSAPGSVTQVRECGAELMKAGKSNGIPVLIVAHVTKSGDLAGPKIVEHLVDTVLQFNGERSYNLRILRAVKNRFGTTNEIGAFEMGQAGLMPVENLSESLMEEMGDGTEGSVATAIYEGTRPLILEIQALATPTPAGFARRQAIGADVRRLNMITAVLERHAGLSLSSQDLYVNVVGGIRPEGTSCDLAVAAAIFSSYARKLPPARTLIMGEIGLTGELRSVQNTDRILREAERLGFAGVILPAKNAAKADRGSKLKIQGVSSVAEALRLIG